MFAFLGTLVLFIMFPSFNGAFAAEGAQFRVVINTALACCASGVTVPFPPATHSPVKHWLIRSIYDYYNEHISDNMFYI